MLALLSPKLWIAAALAALLLATGFTAHRAGRAAVRAEWDSDIAQRTAAALEAERQARAREQELQTKVRKASDAYQAEKTRRAAADRRLDDGLRQFQTILAAPDPASPSSAPSSGNHGTGGLERELLQSCGAALAELGKTADRLEGKVVALQDYIREVVRP